jgi:hypothetical protein
MEARSLNFCEDTSKPAKYKPTHPQKKVLGKHFWSEILFYRGNFNRKVSS